MEQVEKTIEVNLPISTVYNQWTEFEEFPRFMAGVKEVRQIERHTRALARRDLGQREGMGCRDYRAGTRPAYFMEERVGSAQRRNGSASSRSTRNGREFASRWRMSPKGRSRPAGDAFGIFTRTSRRQRRGLQGFHAFAQPGDRCMAG